MLKVVGASWYKTKVSSVIILSALLLSIGALFVLNVERPRLENVYCATADWSPTTGYRVDFWGQGRHLQEIPRGVARICYKGASNEGTEWPHMEIESNPNFTDQVQAFSAGLLEGSLLWNSIYRQWIETIKTPCSVDDASSAFCSWLRETVMDNYNRMKERFKGHMDSYPYQLHLFYQQLEGIEFGWRYGLKRSPMKRSGVEIPIVDFLILNLGTDLRLLQDYYNYAVLPAHAPMIHFVQHQPQTIRLNVTEDSEDQTLKVTLDHRLQNSINSKYRVLKKYKLNYKPSPHLKYANTIVPGHDIVLTSSSGVISSGDEFYAITGRLSRITVAGIDIRYERTLQSSMDLTNLVFMNARVMAANRLATSGHTWARLMKRDACGAKQWLVVDRKVMKGYNVMVARNDNEELVQTDEEKRSSVVSRLAGLVWVVDNVPKRLHGEDITERVMGAPGGLHLEGMPYFQETLVDSGLIVNGNSVEFEYLRQEEVADEGATHSLTFTAKASAGNSEFEENLEVRHSGNEGHEEQKNDPEDGDGDDAGSSNREGQVNEDNRGPAFSLTDFSSKWTWT